MFSREGREHTQGREHTKYKAYRGTLSQAAHREEAPNTGPEPFSRHERSTDLKNCRGMSSSAAHRLEIPVRTAGLVISKSMPSARQGQCKAGGLPE